MIRRILWTKRGTMEGEEMLGSKRPRTRPRHCNILLAVTGSVGAIKGPEIAVRLVQTLHANVRVLLTRAGSSFWEKAAGYNQQVWREMISLKDHSKISIIDADEEWKGWNKVGDPVLHIELRDWADALVIAPLSAHTLAKLANGLCDDTLSCVVRAWDFGHGLRPGKPLILAPAMNTAMWQHPLTLPQLKTIQQFWNNGGGGGGDAPSGVIVVQPQVKTLACGELGIGALASVEEIVASVGGAFDQTEGLKNEQS